MNLRANAIYQERKLAGLCTTCGGTPKPGTNTCVTCGRRRVKNNRKQRNRVADDRIARGMCAYCGDVPPGARGLGCDACMDQRLLARHPTPTRKRCRLCRGHGHTRSRCPKQLPLAVGPVDTSKLTAKQRFAVRSVLEGTTTRAAAAQLGICRNSYCELVARAENVMGVRLPRRPPGRLKGHKLSEAARRLFQRRMEALVDTRRLDLAAALEVRCGHCGLGGHRTEDCDLLAERFATARVAPTIPTR